MVNIGWDSPSGIEKVVGVGAEKIRQSEEAFVLSGESKRQRSYKEALLETRVRRIAHQFSKRIELGYSLVCRKGAG